MTRVLTADSDHASAAALAPPPPHNVVNVLTKYARQGASSRVRFVNLFPHLQKNGWDIRFFPLLDDLTLAAYYRTKKHSYLGMLASYWRRTLALGRAKKAAVWWVEKEILYGIPTLVERLLMPMVASSVVDYDDALYLNYRDAHFGPFGRLAKFQGYARHAAHVTVGSQALHRQMRAWGATRVTDIPSTVNVGQYPVRRHADVDVVTIGWIGTPMTVYLLNLLTRVFVMLAQRHRFRVRVVGASWECPGVDVESKPWSEASETAEVATFDIGIMPLAGGAWQEAKCGYKLIQYMAAGVVPVGSRVGENSVIVQDGENGFLAADEAEWVAKLDRLCSEPLLRAEIGRRARAKALLQYDVNHAASAVHRVFTGVVAKRSEARNE